MKSESSITQAMTPGPGQHPERKRSTLAAGLALCAALAHTAVSAQTVAGGNANLVPKWVGVLALTQVVSDPQAPWFARAASIRLREELGRLPGIMAVMPLLTPSGALADAAAMPDVQWLLGGSVERGASGLSITLVLKNAADGATRWTRRFDYLPEQTAVWRRDAAEAVALELGAQLPVARTQGLGACRMSQADNLTSQAVDAFGSYKTREDVMQVRALLEQALQLEPGCTEAMAHLTMTHISEVLNRWTTDPKAKLAFVDQMSQQAVAANPEQPYAHLARMNVLKLQGNLTAALSAVETLSRIDPSNGLFVGRLAAVRYDLADAYGVLAAARKMQRLPDGTLATTRLGLLWEGVAQYFLGQEDEAYRLLSRVIQLDAKNAPTLRILASIDANRGRDASAAENLKRYLELSLPGQTIAKLRTNDLPATDPLYLAQRERFYAGLKKAGLPE